MYRRTDIHENEADVGDKLSKVECSIDGTKG